ncbi:MAG: hypothetical protein QM754_11760 [Tepidisphaeraceae bacterium]
MSESNKPQMVVPDIWQGAASESVTADNGDSSLQSSNVIEYAGTNLKRRPMSTFLARIVFLLSVVPGIVGLMILGGYRLTGWEQLTGMGMWWLMGGGTATFVLGVIALVNLIRAVARRPKETKPAFWYGWTLGANGAAVISAFVCLNLGGQWTESAHFRMTVRNDTPVPIDRVVVHFQSGDVSVGPISPGQTVRTGLLWPKHSFAPLEITTTAKGLSLRKADRQSFNLWTGPRPPRNCDLAIEPAELPKGVR